MQRQDADENGKGEDFVGKKERERETVKVGLRR